MNRDQKRFTISVTPELAAGLPDFIRTRKGAGYLVEG